MASNVMTGLLVFAAAALGWDLCGALLVPEHRAVFLTNAAIAAAGTAVLWFCLAAEARRERVRNAWGRR